ncbi:MAG: heparinase II/III family protein [Planctomycetota bacterium]
MSARSWAGLLIVFVAVFAAIAYLSYSPPRPMEPPVRAAREAAPGALRPARLQIPPYHPRVLFTDRILRAPDGLRERIRTGGDLEGVWGYLSTRVLRYAEAGAPVADLPAEVLNLRLQALALSHLLDPAEERLANAAIALLAATIDHPIVRNPDYDWQEFPVTEALVFDWCYDALPEAQRKAVLEDMIKRGTYIAEIKNAAPPPGLGPCGQLMPLAFLGLALAGEGEASDRAQQWLTLFRESFVTNVLWRRLSAVSDGSSFALGDYVPRDEVAISRVLRAWKLATEEDLAALSAPGASAGGAYPASSLAGWLGSVGPNLTSDKCAESSVRRPPGPPELFYELASLSGSGQGRSFGDRVFEDSWNALGEDDAGRLKLALSRLLSSPALAPAPNAEAPDFAVFGLSGLVYSRAKAPDGGTLWVAFRPGTSPNGDHFHQNHVSIMRNADALAIDAGFPGAPNEQHTKNYFRTPFAHNTVVLGDIGRSDDSWRASYSPGRLVWQYHDENLSAGIGRATIASSLDKAEFIRTVAVIQGRYILLCDAVLMHRAPGKATWLMHCLDPPTIDGTSSLVEGKRAGGIIESTDTTTFTITSGESALVFRTLVPARAITRVVGGAGYEFRAGNFNYPPGTEASPVSAEALRAQLAGGYRMEIEPDRGDRRLFFIHLGVCGPKDATTLPEISPVEDPSAFRFYVRDERSVIEIAFTPSGQRTSLVLRDRASGAVIAERSLGEGQSP